MEKILEQLNNLKELGYIQKAHLNVLEVALEDYKTEIRAKAIDEFAHQLKENLNQEFPSNYESTRPYFSLENARLIVDDVAEQLKAGGIDG